jgi:mono/diheme cytochrome c family protein
MLVSCQDFSLHWLPRPHHSIGVSPTFLQEKKMTRLSRFSLIMIGFLMAAASFPARSQTQTKAQQTSKTNVGPSSGKQTPIERGRYIVERVAMCERCHTARDEGGNPDRARWLMGGPVQTQPTYPVSNWAQREPRLAGAPPGTDAEFVRLLTTGVSRTGRPPNPPMPPFRMSREDAEAVLAYLKSL